jgi:hypothetical protein
MKKSEINKLDILWAGRIKEVGKCESCLESGWLNACHIIGRRHRATRWGAWIDGEYDLCGWCGCFGCHNDYDEHGPKEDFIRRIVIGEERYQKIREIAMNKITKNQDYETIKGWITNAKPLNEHRHRW